MIATLLAFLGASVWALPTAAGALSFAAAWLFGGDFESALIVGAALAGALLAYKLLPDGLRKPVAGAVLGVGALLLTFRRGERRGAAHQIAKDKADADRAVEKAGRARADADRRNADAARLRDDDGFRRD